MYILILMIQEILVFNLIATTDKPKIINKYSCEYGNSIDITDYDIRIDEF